MLHPLDGGLLEQGQAEELEEHLAHPEAHRRSQLVGLLGHRQHAADLQGDVEQRESHIAAADRCPRRHDQRPARVRRWLFRLVGSAAVWFRRLFSLFDVRQISSLDEVQGRLLHRLLAQLAQQAGYVLLGQRDAQAAPHLQGKGRRAQTGRQATLHLGQHRGRHLLWAAWPWLAVDSGLHAVLRDLPRDATHALGMQSKDVTDFHPGGQLGIHDLGHRQSLTGPVVGGPFEQQGSPHEQRPAFALSVMQQAQPMTKQQAGWRAGLQHAGAVRFTRS